MTAEPSRPIDEIREQERDVGTRFATAFEPYRLVSEELVDIASDLLDDLGEGDPSAEHAMALIAARVATESLAVHHLISAGYAMQAYTIVGSMLELMHTAAFIGGNDVRAREYFEHANTSRAYPGNVRVAIEAVGKEFGFPVDAVSREYDTFYKQMCMVKHGNPMAMSLGTVADEESLYIVIGPVFTPAAIRLGFGTVQQAVRYVLLVLTAFIRHHRMESGSAALYDRVKAASERWSQLNAEAAKAVARLDASAG